MGSYYLSEDLARFEEISTGAPKLWDHLQAGDLESGEPGFGMIGSKSSGRSPRFLLKNGLSQLELLLEGMAAAVRR